jgi:hypothetical protein
MHLGQIDDCVRIYHELLERNPENWGYYQGLEDVLKPGAYFRSMLVADFYNWEFFQQPLKTA